MKKYSANYAYTNHNFVIQNLKNEKSETEYLPGILIIKNLLQRGRPTIMSQFLQGMFNAVHTNDKSFKKPFVLINNKNLKWHNTIKGDEINNYYPARKFLYERIDEDLSEYSFIKQLIVPEIEINQITQSDDENFKYQCVDFYLPQANLVIEIDGQQHKEDVHRISDAVRDEHLDLSNVLTVRIDTLDLEEKNDNYFDKINIIKNRLTVYNRFLNLYKENYNLSFNDIPKEIVELKLLPTATLRFQILILELLETGKISLDDKDWNFQVKNNDVVGFEVPAIEDLFEWFYHLFKLQKIDFNAPNYNIENVNSFSKNNAIKVDFSLMQRWTDEDSINEEIIYVRTDYQDLYYNKVREKLEQVNYFKLSTTSRFNYKFVFNEENDDLEHLEFFLKNIFEYDKFNQGQVPIIQNILENNTTIGLLPTGGGKSLTYQLACFLQPCVSFVVCPIKSLMYDQVKDLELAYIHNVNSINSDLKGNEREQILDNYGSGKYFFVFISPERFQTSDFRDRLAVINNNLNFSYAVIDEVHCLSEWGHDFRTSYLNLTNTINKYCSKINFLGLTATASVNVLKDIQLEFNTDQKNVKTLSDYTRPELEFIVVNDNGNKFQEISTIIQHHDNTQDIFNDELENPKSGLIFTPFVNSNNGCFNLANNLSQHFNQPIKFYSGSKPRAYNLNLDYEKYKIKVQEEFKKNKFPLLTATKAFGMGINKKNISFTIHFGIPASMESLYQEAGRAGRDKSDAKCYVLLSEERIETDLETIFNSESSYEDIKDVMDNIGFNGRDVIRQIFLYQSGLDSIENELSLVVDLHQYSQSNATKTIYARNLNANKAKVEKAIYRLSNLGIVADWTVDDFFNGIFTVTYNQFSIDTIKNTLLNFIKKYIDDFEFDNHLERIKYTNILNDESLTDFESCVKILLQWSYDKFGANRRESLKNVYQNCLKYNASDEGKRDFKKALEAYFKFNEGVYILQHIAENNNRDIFKWFEVFYDVNKRIVKKDELIDLKGSLQRFLESYQTNTGLNLLNGLTAILLSENLTGVNETRFKKSLETISNYPLNDYDLIMDNIIKIAKRLNEKDKMALLKYLYLFSKNEDDKLKLAKEFGDAITILNHYNERIKLINNKIENGFRKIG